jgi:hypothetical protein
MSARAVVAAGAQKAGKGRRKASPDMTWSDVLAGAPWPLWSIEGDGFTPPTNKQWHETLFHCRLAFAIMGRTKKELVELFRRDANINLDAMENFQREMRNCNRVMQTLEIASARIIVVGSAVEALDSAA